MDTLLLVEDDKLLRHVLKENFERENFLVLEASVGRRSLEILQHHHVDTILLDLRLPDGNGLIFITDIRACTDAPLIIVSGEGQKQQKLDSFDLGADDYIGKPFDTDELIARVKAHVRRYKGTGEGQNIKNGLNFHSDGVQFDQWTVDRHQCQIFDRNHQSADLTVQEFQILDFLMGHPGQALKRDDLCQAIRGDSYVPTPRAIDVKITRIRKKIGDDAANPKMIITIRGVGYMFNGGP